MISIAGVTGSKVLWFVNHDMESIVTPVNVDKYEQLLIQSNYNKNKRLKLVKGFREGFLLHYEGEKNITKTAPNLKIRIGSLHDIWEKVMKEVKAG